VAGGKRHGGAAFGEGLIFLTFARYEGRMNTARQHAICICGIISN
jgi:hypothetical protein